VVRPLPLTSTEFSLPEMLAREGGQPVSKADLSEQALGRPFPRFDRSSMSMSAASATSWARRPRRRTGVPSSRQ